jgi:hypothetical protein
MPRSEPSRTPKQDWTYRPRGGAWRPAWLVVVAPEGDVLTPDDLSVQIAQTREEVENIWTDAAGFGHMVVGVYRHFPELGNYVRDRSFGMLGDIRKTMRADPELEEDLL